MLVSDKTIIFNELIYSDIFNIDEQVIVIIDDNQCSIDIILEYFKYSLHQRVMICTFVTASEAIEFILNNHSTINLIISDYHLDNNKKGIEIANMLKTNNIFIPFILISAQLPSNLVKDYTNAGVFLYIDKTDPKFFHKLIELISTFFLS